MPLQTYSFSALVSNIATAMQASATAALNFTAGSVLRAIAEATAGVVLWLQAIILQLLTVTRAATSTGADLDSFVADFGLTRLPAIAATGQVTFGRFTATQQAVIPIGTTVQSTDGTQNFAVTLDTANPAYDATLGSYVLLANTASINVPVQAATAGAGGNVLAGAISVITTPIPGGGVDTVTNGAAFTNGLDAESDPALRAQFIAYIGSLSKGTKTAIGYAITRVQQGLTYTLVENYDYNGTPDDGFFTVVVDDGTGYPSSGLLASVSAAIDAVRPLTSRFGVFAPVVTTANVAMTLTTASSFTHSAVVAAVTTGITNFINSLPLGTSLPYTQLAGIAYAVPGVTNATAITLNSGTTDLTADAQHKLLAGIVSVS